jgi:uncharacterized damage-inducible protein DinB
MKEHPMRSIVCACILLIVPASARAQDRTLTDAFKEHWTRVSGYVVTAAEEMSDANYTFKPTPSVRTFGALIAHISDTSYGICASAIGDTSRSFGNTEKTMSKKADIVAALKDAIAYCNAAFEKLNDQTGREPTSSMGERTPRLATLVFNTNHTWEHYGNIATYFRMKDMVPPSSR